MCIIVSSFYDFEKYFTTYCETLHFLLKITILKKLFAIDICLKSPFSPVESHWLYHPQSRVIYAQDKLADTKQAQWFFWCVSFLFSFILLSYWFSFLFFLAHFDFHLLFVHCFSAFFVRERERVREGEKEYEVE